MKHMKVLSSQKPVAADEVSPIQGKNVFGTLALTPAQGTWVISQIDQELQK